MTDPTRPLVEFDDGTDDEDPGPGATITGPDSEPDDDETAPRNDEVVEP